VRKRKLRVVEVWLSGVQKLVCRYAIPPGTMVQIPLAATEEGLVLFGNIMCGTLTIKIKPARKQ
jgi:hypothetical protein